MAVDEDELRAAALAETVDPAFDDTDADADESTEEKQYECRGCKHRSTERWECGCPVCGVWWNAAVRKRKVRARGGFIKKVFKPIPRLSTGIAGFDRVLGGGLVKGSTALLGGRRGGGKSSICVWIIGNLARAGHKVMYASGEETDDDVASIFARQEIFDGLGNAERVEVESRIEVLGEADDVYEIVRKVEDFQPSLLVVDSIQTVQVDDIKADFGEIAQVKGVVNVLTSTGKRLKKYLSIIAISQITSAGDLAGGTAAQHACDAIFQFNRYAPPPGNDDDDDEDDFEETKSWRVLDCDEKNRRGNADEVAYFDMTSTGRLVEVARRTPPPRGARRLVDPYADLPDRDDERGPRDPGRPRGGAGGRLRIV